MTQLCASETARRHALALLLGSVTCLACGSTDDKPLMRPYNGGGGFAGGGSGGNGSAGAGGSGGTPEPRDAGSDAESDAAPQEPSCRIGSLEDYCAAGFACPATPADARTELQEARGGLLPLLIVQRACSARDGAARISVSGDYASLAFSYIYDAQTRQLVGVQVVNELACTVEGLNPSGFGQYAGYYGEESPGCGTGLASAFVVPAECNLPSDWRSDASPAQATGSDAGLDAGPGHGAPYECILVP